VKNKAGQTESASETKRSKRQSGDVSIVLILNYSGEIKMAKFIVKRKEVYIQEIEIESDNRDEALSLVENDNGIYLEMYYHNTLDSDTWDVINGD
jgi:hypothetical protein